jgi:hypothetical protein
MPKPTMLVPTHAGSSGFAHHTLFFNYGVSRLVVKTWLELNIKLTGFQNLV